MSTVINHVDSMSSRWYDKKNMPLYLWSLPSQIHIPRLIMRKNLKQIPTEGPAIEYLASILQNCQGYQKQSKTKKSLKNCHGQEQPKETW